MQKIFLETQDENLIEKIQGTLPNNLVVQLSSVKELSRLEHLREASHGSVLYSSNPETKHYPMYIGSFVSVAGVQPALDYTKSRIDSIPDGLISKFLGTVKVFPRDIIVFSNKKTWESEAESLVNVLPDNFWGTVGFLAVNNADKLSELYNDVFHYSTFLAGDEISKKKLEHVSAEFVDITHLGRSKEDGLWVRELTRRVEAWETREVDTEFKREE